MLSSRHLLGLDGMPASEIQLILDTARSFREILERPIKRVPTLQGKTVVNLFYEPSTRTRFSLELAQSGISANIVTFPPAPAPLKKGRH